jgi:hypothetical protein
MKKKIARWFLFAALPVALYAEKSSIFEQTTPPQAVNEIDRLVFCEMETRTLTPKRCSDAVFIRRAYLDIIGKIPTAEEAVRFLDAPPSETKRTQLIDELMARDEFADYWAMKWSDALRIKAEFPINLWPNAAQAYHHWVHSSIANNKPYDQFVREMLTSNGSNFRVAPVNFYRAIQNKTPKGIATITALTFMGARTERWPAEQLDDLALFFSQVGFKPTNEWKEENVFWDPLGTTKLSGQSAPGSATVTTVVIDQNTNAPPTVAGPIQTRFPDGTAVTIRPDQDPRVVFADWLTQPENPWFSKCIVNRVWAWLFGRGIVQEPDDIRPDNPPSNPELLDWLAKDFAAHNYDMKHLYRTILCSATYQLSPVSNTEHPEAAAQFAFYPLRRLEAEVLIDAINDITGTTDLYTSAIPEPFTYIPETASAVSIADGSISSSFLTLFGRSARATGMATERDNDINAHQQLHLLNSGHIQTKIQTGPNMKKLLTANRAPRAKLKELYLTILSRYPTDEEIKTMLAYGTLQTEQANWRQLNQLNDTALTQQEKKQQKMLKKNLDTQQRTRMKSGNNDWVDISWALLNSWEFIYRH